MVDRLVVGGPYAAEPPVAALAHKAGLAALVAPGAPRGVRVQAALPAQRVQAGHRELAARAARRVPAVMAARAGRCGAAMGARRPDEVRLADPPAGPEAALSPAALRAMARAMSDVPLVAPVPELPTGEEGRRGDATPERMPASSAPVVIVAIALRRVV